MNFSIIMPVDCNADCDFCIMKNNKYTEVDKVNWLKNFRKTITELTGYHSITITGGEPTSDLMLLDTVLKMISVVNPSIKIVLNTNGFKLLEALKIESFRDSVWHINLSYHSADVNTNKNTFKNYTLYKDQCQNIVDEAGKFGIDVNINAVINNMTSESEINNLILLSNYMGASGLTLRQDIELGLTTSKTEEYYPEHNIVYTAECPVCKTNMRRIKGLLVTWKYGVKETYHNDEPYEYIFTPSGILSHFWDGREEVK